MVFLLCMALGMMCLSGCKALNEPEQIQGEENSPSVSESFSEDVNEQTESDAPQDTNSDGSSQGYFTTTDLRGNIVSQAIFTESKITVLNVWATYCGPCIQEMPYLGELSGEYDSTEVQIVGIPMDVYNEEYLAYANQLIDETGADYTHLLLSQELYDWGLYDIQYVPTTFFVNSEGEVMNTVVGSFTKEDWKKMIDEQLASL